MWRAGLEGDTGKDINLGEFGVCSTGRRGCKERVDPFNATVPAWSAFRSSDYGYTRLTFHNGSHVHLQQVSDDKVSDDKVHHVHLQQVSDDKVRHVHLQQVRRQGTSTCSDDKVRHVHLQQVRRQGTSTCSDDKVRHVHLQQVADDKDGAIIDDFWIRKDTHKAYGDLRQTRAGYL
ncbi:Acid phosphatase type 7 [Amphibalanus amphitrite]|uniref:Acid phosphatase type 7 n=1 Tax=Amphibalanus amphitrite TaxID=1232801 RepID=A0A6A4WV65_AMPAM|nr:Acid phosphatase type 7 [Amphibalanus amphitrite]